MSRTAHFHTHSRAARRLRCLLVPIVSLAAACGDRVAPLQPAPEVAQEVGTTARGASRTPTITSLALASTSLPIGGASVAYTVTVANPTRAQQKGVSIQGEVIQGPARRAAGGSLLVCDGGQPGVLPPSGCTMQFTAVASNTTAGSGTLVAGAADFVLRLYQTSGSKTSELDSRTVAVGLVGNQPFIALLTLHETTVLLGEGAPGTPYDVEVLNPTGGELPGIVLQGSIEQGVAVRAAGGIAANCPPTPIGTLPAGTCTMSWQAVADNTLGGSGTLVPGTATFVLELIQEGRVLDRATREIQLVPNAPYIRSLTLDAAQVTIGGSVGYSITLANPTSTAVADLALQAYVEQGAVSNPAGGVALTCIAFSAGVLPPGDCTLSWAAQVRSTPGLLSPGPATLVVHLFTSPFVILDTVRVPITLVAP